MLFYNEAQRLAHPQAKLIPLSVWKHYFSKLFAPAVLADELISLMTITHYDDLLVQLQNKHLSLEDKKRYWLALAYSHADLEVVQLAELASSLGITNNLQMHLACTLGHLKYFKYVEQHHVNEPLYISRLFSIAAEHGHLEVLKLLVDKISPELVQKMIKAKDYYVFHWAAEHGHLEVLHFLVDKINPEHLHEMIQAKDYYAFRMAAQYGHIKVIKFLVKINPKHVHEMIQAKDYYAFRMAAQEGHVEVIKFLVKINPEHVDEMIKAKDYYAFRMAAQEGHIEVIKFLAKIDPKHMHEMIKAKDYYAFRMAAKYGHLKVLRFLVDKIGPEHAQEMINADDYGAFSEAAEHGHLEVLHFLVEKINPEHIQEMITDHDFYAFKYSLEHPTTVQYLLSFPCVLAYAEQHVEEYQDVVMPFILEQLSAPDITLVTEEQRVHTMYYCLRHLIRRNDSANQDLALLLSNPSIQNLAATGIAPSPNNELLRLALTTNNPVAARALLAIPAVRALAGGNNYYNHELQGGLDLRTLAADRESSMMALSPGEQNRLHAAQSHYQERINAAGIDHCMTHLRNTLKARYQHHPATIDGPYGLIKLPFSWNELQALNLAEPYYTRALHAYYQHTDHSAWRYLAKPNPWMHDQASYVHVDNEHHTIRWSTFEDYQPLIALLYTAVTDKEIPADEGHTLESCLEHFIQELALLGRAHNWDRTRVKCDSQGQTLRDEQGQILKEEYDDLEADRPSCFSGVKRRLFQSVLGHPLFIFLTKDKVQMELNDFLTKDKVQMELNDFVRTYFKAAIHEGNRQSIKKAWDNVVLGLSDEQTQAQDEATLSTLNMPLEQQQLFTKYLAQKYGNQFTDDASFIKLINEAFFLRANESHLCTFGYLKLEALLQGPVQQASHEAGVGFFASKKDPKLEQEANRLRLIEPESIPKP